jgi:hypothetical protein
MKSYELSLVLCPFLALLCLWRMSVARDPRAPPVLLIAAYLFAFGAWFGLVGGVLRVDSAAGIFSEAARRLPENPVLLQHLALAVTAALAALLPNRRVRWVAGLVLVVGAAVFIYQRIQPSEDHGLGLPNAQRAQVPLIMLSVCLLLLIARATALARRAALQPLAAPLLILPLLVAFTIDAADTKDWRAYLDEVCAALRTPEAADGDAGFFAGRRVVKMRYDWEYPTLSVLLRPPGSDRMLQNPAYTDWLPFDPVTEVPDLSAFQTEGICP